MNAKLEGISRLVGSSDYRINSHQNLVDSRQRISPLFVRRLPGWNGKIGSGELEVIVTGCRRLTSVKTIIHETAVYAVSQIRLFLGVGSLGLWNLFGFHDGLHI